MKNRIYFITIYAFVTAQILLPSFTLAKSTTIQVSKNQGPPILIPYYQTIPPYWPHQATPIMVEEAPYETDLFLANTDDKLHLYLRFNHVSYLHCHHSYQRFAEVEIYVDENDDGAWYTDPIKDEGAFGCEIMYYLPGGKGGAYTSVHTFNHWVNKVYYDTNTNRTEIIPQPDTQMGITQRSFVKSDYYTYPNIYYHAEIDLDSFINRNPRSVDLNMHVVGLALALKLQSGKKIKYPPMDLNTILYKRPDLFQSTILGPQSVPTPSPSPTDTPIPTATPAPRCNLIGSFRSEIIDAYSQRITALFVGSCDPGNRAYRAVNIYDDYGNKVPLTYDHRDGAWRGEWVVGRRYYTQVLLHVRGECRPGWTFDWPHLYVN